MMGSTTRALAQFQAEGLYRGALPLAGIIRQGRQRRCRSQFEPWFDRPRASTHETPSPQCHALLGKTKKFEAGKAEAVSIVDATS